MDISEFLASMQPDAASRALARQATQPAIPEAPVGQAGGGSSQQSSDDDASGAAGGGYQLDNYNDQSGQSEDASGYADGGAVENDGDEDDNQPPLSQNIEDRRTTDNTLATAQDFTRTKVIGGPLEDREMGGVSGVTEKGPKMFADGGDVDDDQDAAPATTGAIPTPDEGDGQASTDKTQKQDDSDWRASTMDAISEAVDHGYNSRHGVNRGMTDGEKDPEHQSSVHRMLSGEGAISPKQWDAAQQAIDPTGEMDPATRQLKTIGSLADYYGNDPERKKEAVWGALQLARRKFGAYAAFGTAAADNADNENAAKAFENAANQVPDGINTQITPAGGFRKALDDAIGMRGRKGQEDQYNAAVNTGIPEGVGGALKQAGMRVLAGKPLTSGADATEDDLPEWAKRVMSGGPAMQMKAPEQPAKEPAKEQPAAAGGGQSYDMYGAKVTEQSKGQFRVVQTDPETGKVLLDTVLDTKQLQHAVADGGFDAWTHRGSNEQFRRAAAQTDNHKHMRGPADLSQTGNVDAVQMNAAGGFGGGQQQQPQQRPQAQQQQPQQRPQAQQQQPGTDRADMPGFPPGFDGRGLTVGELSQLRRQYAAQVVSGAPKTQASMELERMKQQMITGREEGKQKGLTERSHISNTSMERRARIAAGQNPDNPNDESGGTLTGKAAQNISNARRDVENQVKTWASQQPTPPTLEQTQKAREQIAANYEKQYGIKFNRGGGGQQPAPQPQQNTPAPKTPQAGQTMTRDGWIYRANPQTKQWEPVQKAQ